VTAPRSADFRSSRLISALAPTLELLSFDNTLESFLSPAKDNGAARQRVLGDFQQVKAVDNTFYGGFAGNRVGFYPLSPFSITDPIFFKVETGKVE
jgi:hypothetical protein